MSHHETAIIGTGPYGLSLAAHLRHRGLDYELFGPPMQSWSRFMPKGMLLKSEGFASNLWDPRRAFTLQAFCREKGIVFQPTALPVPIEVFLAYAAWFQERTDVSSNGLSITGIAKDGRNNFLLTSNDGRQFTARRVVIASGHMPFAYVPELLRILPGHLVAHTTHLHDLSGYAGRDVTVVGAGQSALETAALLVECGARVRVVARGEIKWNPPAQAQRSLWQRIRAPESGLAPGWRSLFYSELPAFPRHLPVSTRHQFVATKWGPAGTAWLFDRLNNKAELLTGRTIKWAEVVCDRARLTLNGPHGAETIDTDAVIAGTGFKADIDRLTMLSASLRAEIAREGCAPKLSAGFETSVQNLHIVGILSAPTFGPVMRFMFGAKHAAPMLARRIAAQSAGVAETAGIRVDVSAAGSVGRR
jgi:cation diffusion facilitator CzcD-associated flavoprotein CzcO